MINLKSVRSRMAMFATTSLVATGLAVGVTTIGALTPSLALAAIECGNPATNGAAADSFNCPAGSYATGILYPTTAGALTLNVQEDATGAVNTTTGGIQVTAAPGDAVTITRSASVAGTGDPGIINTTGAGIGVLSLNGAQNIDLTDPDAGDTPIVVTGSTTGISAINLGDGNVGVTLTNGVVTGQAGDGIDASTHVGAVTVSTGAAAINAQNIGLGLSAVGIAAGNLTSVAGGYATGGITITGTGAINANGTYAGEGVQAIGDGPIVVNETGPITVNGGFGYGVVAFGTAGGSVDITTNSIVLTQTSPTAGGDGIFAYTTGPVTVASGTISTTGLGASGIRVGPQIGNAPFAGDTKVVSGAITTVGDNSPGIEVYSHGLADITSTSVITTGKNSPGIEADSDLSKVTIKSGLVSATGLGSVGIRATGATGVTITTSGPTTADSIGILANSFDLTSTGPIAITTNGDVTSKTDDGIHVSNIGLGAVTITQAAGTTITAGDDGISAFIINPASTAAITVAANGAINPNSSSGVGYGIFSGNAGSGGGTSIALGSTGSITGRAVYGVDASVSGTASPLTIVNNGAIGTALDAVDADGIFATVSNPLNTAVLSVTGTGSINAVGAGIRAVNTGTGATIAGGGAITSGDDGINVISNGAFTVNAGGSITSGQNAVQVNGASGGVINVASGAIVRGLGTSAATAVIEITTPAAALTTINNAGTTRSTNATVAGAEGDLAVSATGGSVTLANTGRIDGRMDFSALAPGSSVLVNNTGAAGIHSTGLTTFSAGNDTFNNGATGMLASSGATTYDFAGDTGLGARDVFNNAGLIVAGETTGASNLAFTGLEHFNNSGTIVFGSLTGGASSDGQTNDRVVMTGTGGGTAFVGSGSSLLVFDANLGTTPQANCVAAVVADCLSLPGGSFSGTNRLRVINTSPGFGSNNPGIVLVDATGGSVAPGSFTLDPGSTNYVNRGGAGAVDTGFFFYRLVPVGTTQIALVSAPDVEAFQFSAFGTAATDVWYATTGSWFDRQADLRDGLGEISSPGHHAGVWLKMSGDWTRRTTSQSTVSAGTTFVFDTSYNQDTATVVGGVDLLGGSTANGAWVVGVQGGYVDSNIRFRASPTRADLSGGVIGGYASLVHGPLYVDGIINANLLTLKDSLPTLAVAGGAPFVAKGGVTSVGGQVESGLKIPLGASASIEPFGSVSYVRTSFDNLTVPGGSVAFNNVTSFRGSLGLRVSTTMDMGTVRIKPTIYARAWDEWRGTDQATLFNPGTPFVTTDRFKGVFGDVGANVAIFSHGGVSAVINGDYKWKSGYQNYTASVALRYQF